MTRQFQIVHHHHHHRVKRGYRTEQLMVGGVALSALLLVVLGAIIGFPAADYSNSTSSTGLATILRQRQKKKLDSLPNDVIRDFEVIRFHRSHRNLRLLDQEEQLVPSGHIPASDRENSGPSFYTHEILSSNLMSVERNNAIRSPRSTDNQANEADAPEHSGGGSVSTGAELPTWMTDYFAWHNDSMQRLNADPSKWKNYKYLVLRCLVMDQKCGGASDRLQSIPLVLRIAAESQRLLFIEWEKPAPLSEFLVPVAIDWTIPNWFVKTNKRWIAEDQDGPYMLFQRSPTIVSDKTLYRLKDHHETVMLDIRYQSTHHGREYYNKQLIMNEPDFDSVYSRVWAKLFRPSINVQSLIDREMKELNLESHGYHSLHIRSIYYRDKSRKKSLVEGAVACAFQLAPTITDDRFPLLLTSDSPEVTKTARLYATEHLGRRVVASSATNPLHLDRGSNFLGSSKEIDWMDHPASAYYSIFADLYLLSTGDCVIYNSVGGYGRWASRIANHSCAINLKEQAQCDPMSLPI